MNRISRAIILAAGQGTRLNPITLTTPKPLVKVNGVRMIETVIGALEEKGISEIYVVVGYQKEKFEVLKKEHPSLTFIFNPYYETCNNISSLYVARDYLEDAIIADADQIIYNKDMVALDFEHSGYHAVWTDEETKEWLLKADDKGMIQSCSRTGGAHGWQLYSLSKWTKEDGIKLRRYLEEEFIEKKNTQLYWDDIALFCYPEEFQLCVFPMTKKDMIEIDSLEELVKVDESYKKYVKQK